MNLPCFNCEHLIAVGHFGTKCSHPLGIELFNESDDFPSICPFFQRRKINIPRHIDRNYTLGK